ncbi:hypothetical protein F511_35197 [Dorcoceras hygrometricum]|uniref:Uncharacterized protein n=1 Tax=Dorcoceras hygrometricum TaxID=472368 RepID=A0A2Z7CYX0_9LAMI|nr:hypothetical protein F511_35197 [Dorcoceras hygrometricum]
MKSRFYYNSGWSQAQVASKCEVALDSSREALPFYTSFRSCNWLVEEHEVAAVRVLRQPGNPGFTAGRGFNPAGGAPGGG